MDITSVVRQLKDARDRAAQEVKRLDAALAALGSGSKVGGTGKRRTLSAAARARIAAAQRARWAKVRSTGQKQNVVTMPKKRILSPAGKRKIAAAARARWAKVRAAKKGTAKAS